MIKFIGIMQAMPAISISENLPVIFLPLITIIFATALKDFFEDYKRKKSDQEENLQKVFTYENGNFTEKAWKQIRAGNIVKVFCEFSHEFSQFFVSAGFPGSICSCGSDNSECFWQ